MDTTRPTRPYVEVLSGSAGRRPASTGHPSGALAPATASARAGPPAPGRPGRLPGGPLWPTGGVGRDGRCRAQGRPRVPQLAWRCRDLLEGTEPDRHLHRAASSRCRGGFGGDAPAGRGRGARRFTPDPPIGSGGRGENGRGGLDRGWRGRRRVIWGRRGTVAAGAGALGRVGGGADRRPVGATVVLGCRSAWLPRSGGGGERADAVERVDVVALPGPAGGQVKRPAAGVAGQAPGKLKEPAA